MIRATELTQQNILHIRVEGKIETDDLNPVLESVTEKMSSDRPLNLYLEIPSLERFEPEAILKSLKFGLQNIGDYISSVEKVAVITDSNWLSTLTSVEDKLLPYVKEKAFEFKDSDQAIAWLQQ
jgi:hypothetical protein